MSNLRVVTMDEFLATDHTDHFTLIRDISPAIHVCRECGIIAREGDAPMPLEAERDPWRLTPGGVLVLASEEST